MLLVFIMTFFLSIGTLYVLYSHKKNIKLQIEELEQTILKNKTYEKKIYLY
ncbi:hypothetical protein SYNTR_0664 [Candidatus Syntrophocurvum alkaliphilum]|uniref:Uncharacterized protein n=1 Tax=Candidatus Syntrophocurvum alkaliphilum TaxID=2293317 RepID=A0A6I6DA23_9FIRM|nr:hypothetical protein [Candidatus Syntrophocurvum alkaliphilum]QGT99257.1 hypothetical protein SYNTR_0664 [Candidatus Syntrophocurvum alkaliphilum]